MSETHLDLSLSDSPIETNAPEGVPASGLPQHLGADTQAVRVAQAEPVAEADAAADTVAADADDTGAIVVDGFVIPAEDLAGTVEEIEPEAAPDAVGPRSGGGNDDSFVLGDIGEGIDITALLPPTALAFESPREEELTPFVEPDSTPTIGVVAIDRDTGVVEVVPNVTDVSETGLDGGSTEGDGSEVATGTITVDTGDDGLGSMVIDGVDVTDGGTVDGEFGTLTVTLLDDGTYSFEYVVTVPVDHPDAGSTGTTEGIADVFTITVTDSNGDTATETLTVGVVDDGPVARDDADQLGGEVTVAEGDLTGNDAAGADGPADDGFVTAADIAGDPISLGEAVETEYGTLTVNADGTYVFEIDEDNADIAALLADETLTLDVGYTVTDGDGDSDTASLTLTITGEDDPVGLFGLDGEDAELRVDESDLSGGSSPDADALTQGGSFTIDTPDGLANVTVGGVALFGDEGFVGPVTIATEYGTLTITGFTPETTPGGTISGGSFTYEFELTGPTGDHGLDGRDDVSEAVPVVVTDRDGDSASSTLDIVVADDVPDAVDDGPIPVTEGSAPVMGSLLANDVEGADGATVTGFTYGGETYAVGTTVATASGGQLTVDADGTYSYTPGASVDAGVEETFTYALTDVDGDSDIAIVTLVHQGDVNQPDAGGGSATLDEDDLDSGLGDAAAGDDAQAGLTGNLGVDFGADGAGSIAFADAGPLTVGGVVYDVAVSEDGLALTLSTGGEDVLVARLADAASGDYSVTLLQPLAHTGAQPGFEDDLAFAFGYTVTDSDGSTASGTLSVVVDDDIPVADDLEFAQDQENATVTVDVTGGFAGGADGVDLESGVAGSLTDGEGELVYNGDGTFSYTPADGEDGSATFTYTVTDAEGDTATATVTIDLRPDSSPGLALAGGTVVDEAGLPDGSNAGDGSETASGTITASTGGDDIGSLLVNGVDVTEGGTVAGAYGTLVVTAGSDGTYTYTYALAGDVDHPTAGTSGTAEGVSDDFEIVLTDSDGDAVDAVLSMDVLDDGPAAQGDSASVGEDGPFTASGDLLANDTEGADGASVSAIAFGSAGFTPGDAIGLDYGTLTVAEDGSYTYALDTSDPANVALVQSLGEGETLTETVTYTLQDGDGDTATADLTITIVGENDTVTLRGLDGATAEITVDEDDLMDGSSPDADSLTQGNSFDVGAPDGLDTVTLGGATLFENGAFVGAGATVDTPLGVVTLTGFTPVTAPDGTVIGGTFDYTYTLETHALEPGSGENIASESLELVATDVDGDTALGTVDIDIIDDVPDASDDGPVSVSEGGADPASAAASGDVTDNDIPGADGASVALTSSAVGSFGSLALNADGTYTYTPDASVPEGSVDTFTYDLVDADGDVSPAVLTFTFTGDANASAAMGGSATVDEDDISGGIGDAATGDDDPSATGVLGADFGLDGAGTILFGDTADVTVNGVTYTFATSSDGLSVTVSDGIQDVMLVTLADATSGQYTVTLLQPLTHSEVGVEDDITFGLAYAVTDSDGSVADRTLSILVDDDLPVASDVFATQATENAPITVDVRPAVTEGADGVDFDTGVGAVLTQGLGTLADNGDGTFTYTPAIGETGFVTFDYTVVDADGDSVTREVQITLAGDSQPLIRTTDSEVDEDGFANANTDDVPLGANETDSTESRTDTNTITVNFGNDLPADLGAAFGFSDAASDLAALNAQGLASLDGPLSWSVSSDGQTLTGNDGGGDVVVIQITGAAVVSPGVVSYTYTVTLLEPLDHPVNDTEDALDLSGIVVVAEDADGSSSEGTFGVSFVDDVPTANPDAFAATEAGSLATGTDTTGNVLANDQQGADGATVSLVGSGTGAHGSLVLNADGSFTYTPDSSVDAGETDVFTYTVTDGDGDQSTATLTFTFAGDRNAPEASTSAAALDDDGLMGGNAGSVANDLDANAGDLDGAGSSEASFRGTLGADYGPDGPASVDAASFANLDGTTQTVGLETVLYSWDAGTGVLSATVTGGTARDGLELFTVALTPGANPGEYEYVVALAANILHPDGPNGEADDVVVSLGYRTVDGDGSVQDGNALTITFDDDAPTATDSAVTQGSEDADVVLDIASLVTPGADGLQNIIATLDPGQDGTLTQNADGTFTFDPVPGQTGTVTVSFVATDGDGDTVGGDVLITLLADSQPTVTVDDGTVSEAGLDASTSNALGGGSAAATDSETTSGTFAITTGNDTVASVTVVDANGIAVDVTAGGTVVGEYGTLTVSVVGGTYTWSYTLGDNTLDHDDPDTVGSADTVADDFTVTVTDSDNSTASDTLTITIEDDGPSALDDSAAVAEDGVLVATGNVISENDTPGADGASVTGITFGTTDYAPGDVIATDYGTLTVGADGSYRFELDNSDPLVQALGPSETVELAFDYAIADGEAAPDTAGATLTITITGADDGVTITGIDAGAPEITVDEDDLPGGSSPDPAALTQGNSFGVDAPDGLDTVTVGGVTIYENGALVANPVVDTSLGLLTITGFTPDPLVGGEVVGGTFTYTYLLQTNDDHAPGNGEDPSSETLAVVVADTDGSSASATLDISIIDDIPDAENDGASVTEDGSTTASGNVISDAAGADTPGADGASVTNVAFDGTDYAPGTSIQLQYGTLTIGPDGEFTYDLDNANTDVQALNVGDTLTETVTYTLRDGDGDEDTATLTLTINGADDGVTIGGLDGAGAEVTVDEDDLPAGSSPDNAALTQGDSFTVDAPDGLGAVDIDGTVIWTVAGGFTPPASPIQTAQGELVVTGFTPDYAADGTTVIGGTFTYDYTLTDAGTHPTANGENTNAESFTVTVADTDTTPDTASATIDITIIDDVVSVTPDADSVTEDTDTVATGNVTINDTPGADGASVVAVEGSTTQLGNAVTLTYGTVTIDANGDYTYQLDGANTAVQALNAGETIQDQVTYTYRDADGDALTTTLTITITGTDDLPTVDPGAGVVVDEEGLADGTNPGGSPTTDSDSFSFTSPDGTDSVTLGGVALVSGGVFVGTGVTVDTGTFGTLTITGFAPVTALNGELIGGTFTYSYTLTDNTTGHTVQGADELLAADLALVVTDTDNQTATASVSIDVVDDAPEMDDFSDLTVPNTDATYTGNNSLDIGADGPGSISITGPVLDGIIYDPLETGVNSDGDIYSTLTARDGDGNIVFTFTQEGDGDWEFDLVTPEASVTTPIDVTNLRSGNVPFNETQDGSVEFQAFNGGTINSSTQGFGVNNQFTGNGEAFSVEFHNPGVVGDQPTNSDALLVDSVSFFVQQINGSGHTVEWTTYDENGNVNGTGVIPVTSVGDFTIDPGVPFHRADISVTTGSGQGLRITSAGYTQTVLPEGQDLNFEVTATDADGDTVTQDINVVIDPDLGTSSQSSPAPKTTTAILHDLVAADAESGEGRTLESAHMGALLLGLVAHDAAAADDVFDFTALVPSLGAPQSDDIPFETVKVDFDAQLSATSNDLDIPEISSDPEVASVDVADAVAVAIESAPSPATDGPERLLDPTAPSEFAPGGMEGIMPALGEMLDVTLDLDALLQAVAEASDAEEDGEPSAEAVAASGTDAGTETDAGEGDAFMGLPDMVASPEIVLDTLVDMAATAALGL